MEGSGMTAIHRAPPLMKPEAESQVEVAQLLRGVELGREGERQRIASLRSDQLLHETALGLGQRDLPPAQVERPLDPEVGVLPEP